MNILFVTRLVVEIKLSYFHIEVPLLVLNSILSCSLDTPLLDPFFPIARLRLFYV